MTETDHGKAEGKGSAGTSLCQRATCDIKALDRACRSPSLTNETSFRKFRNYKSTSEGEK